MPPSQPPPPTEAWGSECGRSVGVVKSFMGLWGFASVEGLQNDVLVHLLENPSLGSAPAKGELLEFDVTDQGGKLKAYNATRQGAANPSVGYDSPNAASADTSTGLYQGTLASYRDGWGLISSDSVDGKLFCGLIDNPKLESISVGDVVNFGLATNPKDGRMKAVNASVAAASDPSERVGQRVRGVVKSSRADWGFATSSTLNSDVMLGQANLRAAGISNLIQGTPLEFDIVDRGNGRFEAVNIQVMGGKGSGKAYGKGGADARARSRTPPPMPMARGVPGLHVGGGALSGTIKAFKGTWGFVISNQAQGDIYFNLKDSPSFTDPVAGEAVQFQLVQYQAQPGRNNGAQAVNLERGGQHGLQQPPTQPPSVSGTLTWWDQEKMWGWIQVAGRDDVFFGLKDNPQIPSASIGDSFVFQCAMGNKGKYKAVNAQVNAQPNQSSDAGQWVSGQVKLLQKGFGFCTVEGMASDVLLGGKSLQNSGVDFASLTAGEVLQFELAMGPKGYEAVKIQRDA